MKPSEISDLLRKEVPGMTGISALKFYYRPYICPFELLIEHVDKNSDGFGSGLMLLLANKIRSVQKLGGIEISESLLSKATQLLKDASVKADYLYNFDGMNIPDEIRNFRNVSMIDVYHHIPKNNQEEFVHNLYHKMSPGSKLIFKDIDASIKLLLPFNKLHDMVVVKEIGNEISAFKMLEISMQAGFKLVDLFQCRMFWYSHFCYILKK